MKRKKETIILAVAFVALGLFIFRSGIFYADKNPPLSAVPGTTGGSALGEAIKKGAMGTYAYENRFFAIEYPETWTMENITGTLGNQDMLVRLASPFVQTEDVFGPLYTIAFVAYAPEQFIVPGVWGREREGEIASAIREGDVDRFIALLDAGSESMSETGHSEFVTAGDQRGYLVLAGNNEIFIRGTILFLAQGHVLKIVINESEMRPLSGLADAQNGLWDLLLTKPYGDTLRTLKIK